MNGRLLAILFLVGFESLYGDSLRAQMSADDQRSDEQKRMDAVTAEVQRRRSLPHGAVFQPTGKGDPLSFACADLALINVGQFYADVTRKEVMISMSVSRTLLTVRGLKHGRQEVLDAINKALKDAKVRVVEVTAATLVLVPES